MLLEKIEKGKKYDIHWVDGHVVKNCIYVDEHRGFLIFIDSNDMKIICRCASIKSVTTA